MAEAFLALSGDLPGLRTLVVVKRILPHLSASDQFVRMFLDEARIGALLDHPNIPRIIEVGHDDDGYFLAMEAVPGKPLSSILRRALRRERPLAQEHAAFIVGRAAAALGYAHALTDADGHPLNIVHRDVSPENILVSFEGAVKVIDFGIASAHGRISQTQVGGLKGKVQYMSPEQAAGAPVDRRSDVFALGIVLWEALSGRRLFRRETDLAVMRAITNERVPRPSGPQPIPARLERIVMTALEREPEDRFQDAHEMAVLLERHAFRTDDFDPADLVAQIKHLFPADHAGWKATVGSAQATDGGHGPRRITSALPTLAGAGTHTAGPTVVLPKQQRGAAAALAHTFPAEPSPELENDGRPPPLSQLTGWGGAQPDDPGSDGGELSSAPGDDAAAYAALRAWSSRRIRRARPAWLLAGAAVVAAGVFAVVRWSSVTPIAPPPPPSIVDTRGKVAAERPVVERLEPLESMADPASVAPPPPPPPPLTTEAAPAIPPPAPTAVAPAPVQRPPRPDKRIVRKPAHVPRAAPVTKSSTKPAKPAAVSKAAKPARAAWRDPFQ